MRGAHHRRCAREGLTAVMMPYAKDSCKSMRPLFVCSSYKIYFASTIYVGCGKHEFISLMIVPRLDKLLANEKRTFYWLAKQTGVSHTTLWRLKKGKAVGINFETLEKICRVLRCQPGDVLFLTNSKTPPSRQSVKTKRKSSS